MIIEEKNAESNMSNLNINCEVAYNANILNSDTHPIKNISPVLNLNNLTGNLGNNFFDANNDAKRYLNADESLISIIPSNSNKVNFNLEDEKELAEHFTPLVVGAKKELTEDNNNNIKTVIKDDSKDKEQEAIAFKVNKNNKEGGNFNKDLSDSNSNSNFCSSASVSFKDSSHEVFRNHLETVSGNQLNEINSDHHIITNKNSDDTLINSVSSNKVNENFATGVKSTEICDSAQMSRSLMNTNKNTNVNKSVIININNNSTSNETPTNNNNNNNINNNNNNNCNNNTINTKEPNNHLKNPTSFLDGVNFIVLNLGKDAGERKVPFHLFPKILEILIDSINSEDLNFEIDKLSGECNETLHSILEYYNDQNTSNIKLFEHILKKYFKVKNDLILNKLLVWISRLFKKFHEEMFIEINSFIDNFTDLLTRESDTVFCAVLEILCEISKYKDEYIEIIIRQILEKLALNLFLLQNRATKIIKNFCQIIEVNRVYLTFAEELKSMKVNK